MLKIQLLVNRRNGIGLEFCLALQLKQFTAETILEERFQIYSVTVINEN